MTMFDNIWVNTKDYANYANITGTLVACTRFLPIDPRLNFPPKNSYQDRLIPLIDKEPARGADRRRHVPDHDRRGRWTR